jgi:WD repeat-containing protein 13
MGRSLEETYAFSGVHHIFDHHRGSGKIKILYNFDLFMLVLIYSVTRVQFAPNDRSLLATCGRDGILAICQVLPTPATIIYRLKGHTAVINGLLFLNLLNE